MRINLLLASAALSVLGAMPAAAQDSGSDRDERGVYVALRAGVATIPDTTVTYYDVGGTFGGTGASDTASTTADLQSAATFGGAIGYDFGIVRADLEVSYARNKVKSITLDTANGAPVTLTAGDAQDVCDYLEVNSCTASGNTISFSDGPRLRQLSAMANIWIDVPVGNVVVPYIGGGIGATGFEMDGEGTGKFSWQVGGGVAVNLSAKVAITADFRHREVSGETFPWDANSGFSVGRLKTNSLTGGLRIRF